MSVGKKAKNLYDINGQIPVKQIIEKVLKYQNAKKARRDFLPFGYRFVHVRCNIGERYDIAEIGRWTINGIKKDSKIGTVYLYIQGKYIYGCHYIETDSRIQIIESNISKDIRRLEDGIWFGGDSIVPAESDHEVFTSLQVAKIQLYPKDNFGNDDVIHISDEHKKGGDSMIKLYDKNIEFKKLPKKYNLISHVRPPYEWNEQMFNDKFVLMNLGFELEVSDFRFGANNCTRLQIGKRYGVGVGTDGSVTNGLEIRTATFRVAKSDAPAMYRFAESERWRKLRLLFSEQNIFPEGRETTGYDSCGGHIHVSVPGLSVWHLIYVIAQYADILSNIQIELNESREDSQYWEACDDVDEYARENRRSNIWVNGLDTVEIRLFDAPINVDEIKFRVGLIKLILLNQFTETAVRLLAERYYNDQLSVSKIMRAVNESELLEVQSERGREALDKHKQWLRKVNK